MSVRKSDRIKASYKGVVILFLFLVPRLAVAESESPAALQTENGAVRGAWVEKASGMQVFRGIPFAKPPVGDLRWRPPQRAENWEGVRVCDQFSAAAPQKVSGSEIPKLSEDCLYLNVWTRRAGDSEAKWPVMVWIHGGGLNRGWGHKAYSDGVALAKRDVVLVSINYRLGTLGFLAHPALSAETEKGVSGNYGFLDQIQALKWVRQNIQAFGGDPENVTIFGESAGGTSVSVLCASPLARGLFHRAIIQSPWMFGYITRLAEPNTVSLRQPVADFPSGEALGGKWAGFDDAHADAARRMRALSTDEILEKASYYKTRVTIDGWLLPKHPIALFAEGRQANIPVMIGTTKDEGNFFRNWVQLEDRKQFVEKLRGYYGKRADEVVALYPGESKDALKEAGSQFVTDSWFLHPTRQLLHGMGKVSSPAFQYEFTQANRQRPELGAPHAAELKFVFNTFRGGDPHPEDQQLATLMGDLWVRFAKTGNPNGKGLPEWPAYDPEHGKHLKIGSPVTVAPSLRQEACDVLDRATRALALG